MNNRIEDELSHQEQQALDRLREEKTPPASLEERIVNLLKEQNLIRTPKAGWWPGAAKIAIAFAASLALFFLGTMAGAWWASAPANKADMPEFLLVLRTSLRQSEEV